MKALSLTVWTAVLFATASFVSAQEVPKMAQPTKEHAWLQQFVGTWDYEVEIFMEPGKPPMKAKGTEVARMVGGFWVVGESKGAMGEMVFTNVTTFGYDPEKKKYVGTAIDSASSTLWKYEGEVDATGKILTFGTEGPCPMRSGKITKFREVLEFKDKDTRVFTSAALDEGDKWTTNVIVTSRRRN